MQYLKQIALIFVFSFLGEVCRAVIPLPIPASIYGMVLLFAALSLKIVKSPQVKDAGSFLTSILPVLFVAPAVNLMDCWDQMKDAILPPGGDRGGDDGDHLRRCGTGDEADDERGEGQ